MTDMLDAPMTTAEGGEEFADLLRPFSKRKMPDCLRPGAPTPESWNGPSSDWERLAARARDAFQGKPHLEAALAVAQRGFTPQELISGRLAPGAEVNIVTGRVVRHWAEYDDATMKRARELKHQLARDRAPLAPILMGDLEAIGQGRQVGSEKRLRIVLEAAATALRQHQAERKAATQEEAAKLRLAVRRRFRGIGGRQYAAGEYRIDRAEADELRLWQERMEAQANQHDWDAPSGFTPDSWPPFSIEEGPVGSRTVSRVGTV